MEFPFTNLFPCRTIQGAKAIFENGGGFIQDRSIYEDTGIFAKMHMEKGTMDPVDYDTYTNLFEAMVMTPYFPHPDLACLFGRSTGRYYFACPRAWSPDGTADTDYILGRDARSL